PYSQLELLHLDVDERHAKPVEASAIPCGRPPTTSDDNDVPLGGLRVIGQRHDAPARCSQHLRPGLTHGSETFSPLRAASACTMAFSRGLTDHGRPTRTGLLWDEVESAGNRPIAP